MPLKFTKMHGLGNDFIVIDAINQPVNLSTTQLLSLANRHTGIGFDQCLLVEKSTKPDIDFFYRIFNANGQEVGQCGNGARCLARFVYENKLTNKTSIRVATTTTLMQLIINADNSVTVEMGLPRWQPTDIPLQATHIANDYDIPLQNGATKVHAVSVGNPHAILVVADLTAKHLAALGKEISEHPYFPEQCNISFMQLMNAQHIQLRVYERGAGETLACGSAAVAAVAVGRRFYQLDQQVHVQLPGGELIVDWPSEDQSITLTGTANFVYEGTLHPCAL